jgi:HupE / UreJ protein
VTRARLGALLRLAWVLGLLGIGLPATAHEIRPAYLQIEGSDDQGYRVLWKQPTAGEVAVRLVPHLSGGGLEGAPAAVQANASFLILQWNIPPRTRPPLDGQTVSVEGLPDTITDALVVVHAGATSWQTILTPAAPAQRLTLAGTHPPSTLPAFLRLGIEHILTGVDHLLFVLGLLLIAGNRWMLLKTITAFTVAHSITLALAVLGVVRVPITLIDALIGLSILFLAPEALRRRHGHTSFTLRHPWYIAFIFGLLHGFGFAGGLSAAGLPADHIPAALLLFNVGVELGQLAFVAGVLLAWQLLRRFQIRWPQPMGLLPAYVLGTAGAFWTIQRVALLLGGSA